MCSPCVVHGVVHGGVHVAEPHNVHIRCFSHPWANCPSSTCQTLNLGSTTLDPNIIGSNVEPKNKIKAMYGNTSQMVCPQECCSSVDGSNPSLELGRNCSGFFYASSAREVNIALSIILNLKR